MNGSPKLPQFAVPDADLDAGIRKYRPLFEARVIMPDEFRRLLGMDGIANPRERLSRSTPCDVFEMKGLHWVRI